MSFKNDLVDDREKIPALDEPELMQLNETRLAKLGQSVVAALGAVAAGVVAFIGLNNDVIKEQNPGLVLVGAAFLIAISILAWAIVAAADIRARGAVTAANLGLRARPSLTVAPAGASGESSGLWCHLVGREKGDTHLVVDSRVVRGDNEYLLARNDETPRWYKHSEIDSWEVKAG